MPAAVFLKLAVIVLVVGIGYIVGRMGWLSDDAAPAAVRGAKPSDGKPRGADPSRVLGHAAFYIFVPALLFRATARIDFARMPWGTLAAFFAPLICLMTLVYFWQRRVRPGATVSPSVRALTACFGNSVQLGIPMATAMFGDPGLQIHIAIVSLHALVLLTLLTARVEVDIARERVRRGLSEAHLGRMLMATARKTVIHPVVLPILAGLAWNACGLPLPAFLDEVLVLLGQAVVPMCLVLIGLALAHYGLASAAGPALGLAFIKLVVQPTVVLVVGHWGFGLEGLPLSVVVMAAALPIGNNALIFAQRYRWGEGETTAAIAVSTFAFALTAPAWLWVLGFFH